MHTTVLFVCSIPPSPQPTEQVSLKKKVSTTVPPVSGQKSDTEETKKQKKINRGKRLGSDPTWPTTSEKGQDISLIFLRSFLLLLLLLLILLCGCFFSFLFLLFLTFLKFKSSISSLIFIFITYYYFSKKTPHFFIVF